MRVESRGAAGASQARNRRSPYAPAQEDPSKRGNYTRGGLYAPGVADSAPTGGIPDVDLIPEPEVRDEPHSRYGNRSPYKVLGKTYRVLDSAEGYDEVGTASFYGNKFHGRRTSNLEVYDMYAFTAAHKTLPLPSFARVTNLANGRSVVVRVNDRGPFHDGRIIDLSYAAAVKLGVDRMGTARVEVQDLMPGEVLAHMGDLLQGSLFLLKGELVYLNSAPLAWEDEVKRFFAAVREFDAYLASNEPLIQPLEKIMQGPISDALTHVGQIVMLRRAFGVPVQAESYFEAEIIPGQIEI